MRSEPQSLPEKCVIFDTEFTAWEGSQERGWSGPNEHREIIQIGAVKTVDLEEVDSFLCVVRPTKNPQLSAYITDLTGITQKEIDTNGVSFPEALERFYAWCDGLPMFSMNGGDGHVLAENSELNHTPVLFGDEAHQSASAFFQRVGINTTQYTSGTIPLAFGLTPPPDAHNALNDARSILLALQELRATQNS